ncbi:MAG: hypothetical protein ACTSQZ_08315 [Candidatus Thorarchaeota archaeon]
MGSIWLSRKAFLYFGGAFILLLGGAIVLSAPYHTTGYISMEGDLSAFEIWEGAGYYSQLEISIIVQPAYQNNTVEIDIHIHNNETLAITSANITLTMTDILPEVESPTYEKLTIVDLDYGAYTIHTDRISGAADFDLGLTQVSDSRTFVVIGGIMNIVGLIMGATGYLVSGILITSGDEAIVYWGSDYLPPKTV